MSIKYDKCRQAAKESMRLFLKRIQLESDIVLGGAVFTGMDLFVDNVIDAAVEKVREEFGLRSVPDDPGLREVNDEQD